VLQEGNIVEEIGLFVYLLELKFFEDFVVVCFVDGHEVALFESHNCGSSWFIEQKSKLAEKMTLMQLMHFYEPFQFVVVLKLAKLLFVFISQHEMLINVKHICFVKFANGFDLFLFL
jgi:hypothetical protein